MFRLVVEKPDERCVCKSTRYTYAVSKDGCWYRYKRGDGSCCVIAEGIVDFDEMGAILSALADSEIFRMPRVQIIEQMTKPGGVRAKTRELYNMLGDD